MNTDFIQPSMPRVVVLISGRGSNLSALLEANLPVHFAAVMSNKAGAGGLLAAEQAGIPTEVINHKDFEGREAFDRFLAQRIDHYLDVSGDVSIDARKRGLVVLAGFMRIFSAEFTARYTGRMINIHPSLLPAFTGLHTHQRALDEGVKIHGCTVHLVTAELDHGPILAQAAVPVLSEDTEASLAARVLRQEHQLYPQVVRAWAEGRLKIDEHGMPHWGYEQDPSTALRVPGVQGA
jgi:phosphoribosylglycinamide formyltransferase 1